MDDDDGVSAWLQALCATLPDGDSDGEIAADSDGEIGGETVANTTAKISVTIIPYTGEQPSPDAHAVLPPTVDRNAECEPPSPIMLSCL